MAQYGDEANADEAGSENIHVSDYGNSLYAEVITEGFLPLFDDWTDKFSDEHKGDVVESLMGLNFLEKEERLDCNAMGITHLEDAAEVLLRAEWSAYMKGLTWTLAVLQKVPVVLAIIALREICCNWEWSQTEKGGNLWPCNARKDVCRMWEAQEQDPRLFMLPSSVGRSPRTHGSEGEGPSRMCVRLPCRY
eukprot:2689015-Amphidinium_carterae.1